MKIIAITYFFATLAILDIKIAIARYLDLKLIALDSHQNFASIDVFEVYFTQNSKNFIFTTIFRYFLF